MQIDYGAPFVPPEVVPAIEGTIEIDPDSYGRATWTPQRWIAIHMLYVAPEPGRRGFGFEIGSVAVTIDDVTYALAFDGKAAFTVLPNDSKPAHRNFDRWFEDAGTRYIAVPPGCRVVAHVRNDSSAPIRARVLFSYRNVSP